MMPFVAIPENVQPEVAERFRKQDLNMMVEHPTDTIKRQSGYTYTLLKGMEKVGGEFAITFPCYNLRRVISILGIDDLKKHLKEVYASFFELFVPFLRRFIPKIYFYPLQLAAI
jgi:hypothetical protein